MHRTGHARVKRVDGAQRLQGLLRIRQGVGSATGQRRLVGAEMSVGVTSTGEPCGWNHSLVVVHLAVFDGHPVGEKTTRHLHHGEATCFFRPGTWLPLGGIKHVVVAVAQAIFEGW